VETGSLRDLRHMTRTTVVAETAQAGSALADLPGVHGLQIEAGQLRFEVDGDQVDPVLRRLSALGVRSIVAHPPSLEQLLMRHYGDDLRARSGHRQEVG
jgi:ABC-2 type transport system ATP-binding protein